MIPKLHEFMINSIIQKNQEKYLVRGNPHPVTPASRKEDGPDMQESINLICRQGNHSLRVGWRCSQRGETPHNGSTCGMAPKDD